MTVICPMGVGTTGSWNNKDKKYNKCNETNN